MTFPPLETDTWPACRPLVEWAVGLLPDRRHRLRAAGVDGRRQAGAGRALLRLAVRRPAWTTPTTAACSTRCCGSAPTTGPATRCAGARWRSRSCWPTGSPARSSPTCPTWRRRPSLLRAFIRFSHAERGIRAELTAETLAAVDELEPEYQATIRTPRPQGPAALLARHGRAGPGRALGRRRRRRAADLRRDHARAAVSGRRRRAGPRRAGRRAAARRGRSTGPACPTEVRERAARGARRWSTVAATRCWTSSCGRRHAGCSHGRRRDDPQALGRGRADTTAAAICWIAAKANDVFDDGDLTVKQLRPRRGRDPSATSTASGSKPRGRPGAHPLGQLVVLGMGRVGEDLQQPRVPVRAAAVLGRAGTCAVQTGRRLGGRRPSHADVVLPAVAEVVVVAEHRAVRDATETASRRGITQLVHVLDVAVGSAAELEQRQVRALPAHDGLQQLRPGRAARARSGTTSRRRQPAGRRPGG